MGIFTIKKLSREERSKINLANEYLENEYHINTAELTKKEVNKTPYRYDIINYLFSKRDFETTNYLEIGVRNPEENFKKINAKNKYSVDPGIEVDVNLADFPYTSDEFFLKLSQNEFKELENIKFDIIFIDGLHLAEQVDKDIKNSLQYLKDDGFIVMHDCNPPTEFHATENYYYRLSPSESYWNGTTWKAFFKHRQNENISSCCIDTDWGIGVISKTINLGPSSKIKNDFFEYYIFNENRKDSLNLVSFEEFTKIIEA